MADQSGSGGLFQSPESTPFVDFLIELLQGSPHPRLGLNDPPEWRRSRAREQLVDWVSRTAYGKSLGEVQRTDILAAALSTVPVGRFAPTARGGIDALRAAAGAGRAGDVRGIVQNLIEAWLTPLPTHAPMTFRDLALYGRFPARRGPRLVDLLEQLFNAAIAASPENTPPGSVNPAAMP